MTCPNSFYRYGLVSHFGEEEFYHAGDEPSTICRITNNHCPLTGEESWHAECPLVRETENYCPNCLSDCQPSSQSELNTVPKLYRRYSEVHCMECGHTFAGDCISKMYVDEIINLNKQYQGD